MQQTPLWFVVAYEMKNFLSGTVVTLQKAAVGVRANTEAGARMIGYKANRRMGPAISEIETPAACETSEREDQLMRCKGRTKLEL